MNLNIQLISNGLIVSLQTPVKGSQVVFVPTKEQALEMITEIFKGIQQSPTSEGSEPTAKRN